MLHILRRPDHFVYTTTQETDTQDKPIRPKYRLQLCGTDTHDTPTRPEYRLPACGNRYTQHTYKTQNTGRLHVETDTHDTPTRPEYRSPVCENRYTHHRHSSRSWQAGYCRTNNLVAT